MRSHFRMHFRETLSRPPSPRCKCSIRGLRKVTLSQPQKPVTNLPAFIWSSAIVITPWYKMGYDTLSRKTDLSDAEKNLWLFRWESAQARVAARRGNADEAQQHVKAAKVALDNANNPDQMRFYPYLTGYAAFYAGDYKTSIAELQKADMRDPFILVLFGQAYEKSGDASQARDYYRKVLEINFHNPTNAFARPLAKKKLEVGS